jgi:hypothetical protein
MVVMAKFPWVVALLVACGNGSGSSGDPLLSGTISGSFEGDDFTPSFGFATLYEGAPLIGLAEDDVHCGSESMNAPPRGNGVILSSFAFEVGSHDAFVQVFRSAGGDYASHGSSGIIEITAITDESIAGTVDFDSAGDGDLTYSAHGDFQVVNCGI